MMSLSRSLFAVGAVLALTVGLRADTPLTSSLKSGDVELKSASALAFGPDGVLFVGDSMGAAVYAFDTNDATPPKGEEMAKIANIDEKIASVLGIEAKQLSINALAVSPLSRASYLGVARGKAPNSPAVLIRVGRDGKISEFSTKNVKFAKAELPNAPSGGNQRAECITGLAYMKGKVIIAGLSNEEFASKLRVIPFPFTATDKGASIEIFHGNHGRIETASPVRTFVPYEIKGEANILAAYTCTPLVKIPLSDLKAGEKVKGTTIAELGNRNKPLDMIVYQKDGKDYILMANSARGVMKIPTEGIEKIGAITQRVSAETAGLKYESIGSLKGVQHLASLDKTHGVILVKTGDNLNLETIELP
jgi:hypothetical protein